MTKAKASAGGDAPSIPAQAHPFLAAARLQVDNQLNAGFARKALITAIVTSTVCLLQMPLTGWLAWKVANPPVRYFATHNGSILEQHPTHVPAYSDDDVEAFGDRVIRDAFRLDFKNYGAQISSLQQKFSEEGFISYYNALTASNPFRAVKEQKMLMSPSITRKGVIKRRGNPGGNGAYVWEIQYPVTLSLDGQNRSLPPQDFIFTVRIQRTEVSKKPQGIEVASIVTRNAR